MRWLRAAQVEVSGTSPASDLHDMIAKPSDSPIASARTALHPLGTPAGSARLGARGIWEA
jgi:hypothetical protein